MRQSNSGIQNKLDSLVARRGHHGAAFSAYRENDGAEFHFKSGNLTARKAYFGMSTTHLYVTAIILQMCAEGKLALDTPFTAYLTGHRYCENLHVLAGEDYTENVTLRHLMQHRSGLQGRPLFDQAVYGRGKDLDAAWTVEDVVARVRSHGAICAPGGRRRALYSDAHFHLLGKVIEEIDGMSFAKAVQCRITQPLGLTSTYVYCDPSDRRPATLIGRRGPLHVPLAMASLQAESGIVTTSREALLFCRAFFEGYLFDRKYLKYIEEFSPMRAGISYGLGFMQAKLPWIARLPAALGAPTGILQQAPRFSGYLAGNNSFLFFAPEERIYIAGTLNKMASPNSCLRLLTECVEAIAQHKIAPVQPPAAPRVARSFGANGVGSTPSQPVKARWSLRQVVQS